MLRIFLTILFMISIFGCDDKKAEKTDIDGVTKVINVQENSENNKIDIVFREPVTFIERLDGFQDVSIDGTAMEATFSFENTLPKITEGEIVGGNLEGGYYFRVKSVNESGNILTLGIEELNLNEVIESGSYNSTIPFGEREFDENVFNTKFHEMFPQKSGGEIDNIGQWEGDSPWWDPKKTFCFDVDIPINQSMEIKDIYKISIKTLNVEFCGTGNFTQDFNLFGTKEANITITTIKTYTLEAEIDLLVLDEIDISKDIAKATLAKIPLGGLPITVDVDAGIKLGFKVNCPQTGKYIFKAVKQEAEQFNAHYLNGTINESQKSGGQKYSTVETINEVTPDYPITVKATLGFSLTVAFNALIAKAGIKGTISPYIKGVFYTLDRLCMDMVTGVSFSVKLFMKVFGWISREQELWEKDITFMRVRMCDCVASDDCPGNWGCLSMDEFSSFNSVTFDPMVCSTCSKNEHCEGGKICKNSKCQPCQVYTDCDSGEVCYEGQCLGSFCGDGLTTTGEECDPVSDTIDESCQDFGYYGGIITCNDNCTYNKDNCISYGSCGDNVVQSNYNEVCDGTDLAGGTCENKGLGSGMLQCSSDCRSFDFSLCSNSPSCGNGISEPALGELCDGSDLSGKTCATLSYYGGGNLSCLANCNFDVSGCERCGDGIVNGPEVCDGTDLGGNSCTSLGLGTGNLSCKSDCTLELSGCVQQPVCGDGLVTPIVEVCDGTSFAFGDNCNNHGFYEGVLTCNNCTSVSDSSCTGICGDNIVDSSFGESCDGDISGQQCSDFGLTGDGAPSCTNCRVTGCQFLYSFAPGSNYNCGLDGYGQAWCWGNNQKGQLGNGTKVFSLAPTEVMQNLLPGFLAFEKISSGNQHSCGLDIYGNVWCWGNNDYGQLGNGTISSSATPILVDMSPLGSEVFTDISIGASHSCGLDTANNIWCWGYNSYGQLGIGNTTDSSTPVIVDTSTIGSTHFTSVALGDGNFTCALTADNKAWCWGDNHYGQLGNNHYASNGLPSLVYYTNLGSSYLTELHLGVNHSCGLDNNGIIWCWGHNNFGQVGNGSSSDAYKPVQPDISGITGSYFIKLATGYDHSCGLDNTGNIWCWGRNYFGQLGTGNFENGFTPLIVDLTNFNSVSPIDLFAGSYNTCSIDANGTNYCWGNNNYGQMGNQNTRYTYEPKTKDATSINGIQFSKLSVGKDFSCGISTNHITFCWGNNDYGQLGNGTTDSSLEPVEVDASPLGTAYFVDISSGFKHTCGIDNQNRAWCWGDDSYGKLGDGTATSGSTIPSLVDTSSLGTAHFVHISAGNSHSCGVDSLGRGWCWGLAGYGQLGNGSSDYNGSHTYSSPVSVIMSNMNGELFSTIYAGSLDTCGITTVGNGWCWGNGLVGQLGNNSNSAYNTTPNAINMSLMGTAKFTEIAVSSVHTCGIDTMGRAWCWGLGDNGQLGTGYNSDHYIPNLVVQPNDFSGSFEHIQTGFNSTCAVDTNGKSFCWGYSLNGLLGNGLCEDQNLPSEVIMDNVGGNSFQLISMSPDSRVSCGIDINGQISCWGDYAYGLDNAGIETTPVILNK